METIISAAITGVVGIVVAALGIVQTHNARESTQREKRRVEEGRLQLKMLNANSELTIGVAMALKNGHCNGEVEAGLAAVKEATADYRNFLENIAIETIK